MLQKLVKGVGLWGGIIGCLLLAADRFFAPIWSDALTFVNGLAGTSGNPLVLGVDLIAIGLLAQLVVFVLSVVFLMRRKRRTVQTSSMHL